MKFLFAVTDFDMGGITSSLKNLTDELIFRGNEVAILNISEDKEFPVEFSPSIKFIETRGLARYWSIGISNFESAKGIKKVLWLFVGLFKKILAKFGMWERFVFSNMPIIPCDVAVAFRQSSALNYLVTRKTTAKRTIAFIHSEIDGNTAGWIPYIKDVDRIACVSKALEKEFAERFPQYKDKVYTVYNIFDAESIKKRGEEKNPYSQDDAFRIVTVARIEKEQKRVDIIPEIVQEIKKKSERKIHWYIVGDGPDRSLLEENIEKYGVEENITLTGAKKNPYPYIKNADLFVLISLWESYGMVIVESLILGTPVLAAEYPAVYEIIDNEKNGLIVENSTEGVVSGILRLMETSDLYENMKNNCAEYEYSPDIAYNQLMDLI